MFEMTFIYGNPTFANRINLWNKILRLKPSNNSPWCCMGDLNEMCSNTKKDGLIDIEPIRLDLFRDFLNSSGLMDMELQGSKFTWLN